MGKLSSRPISIFVPPESLPLFKRTLEEERLSQIYINSSHSSVGMEFYFQGSSLPVKKSRSIKTCFVLSEPPEILKYPTEFLDIFDYIAGPNFSYLSNRNNLILHHPQITPFVGIRFPVLNKFQQHLQKFGLFTGSLKSPVVDFNLSELKTMDLRKNRSLSVIMSLKNSTPQQSKRIEFLKYLQRETRIPLKIRGGVNRPIADKFELLSGSTHHISIENSQHEHYWTEKFSDSLLSLNHTFYCGAPNINDYFDEGIFTRISLDNFSESLDIIEHVYFERTVNFEMMVSEREKLFKEFSFISLVQKMDNLL